MDQVREKGLQPIPEGSGGDDDGRALETLQGDVICTSHALQPDSQPARQTDTDRQTDGRRTPVAETVHDLLHLHPT